MSYHLQMQGEDVFVIDNAESHKKNSELGFTQNFVGAKAIVKDSTIPAQKVLLLLHLYSWLFYEVPEKTK